MLRAAAKAHASDVHIHAGAKLQVRINGELKVADQATLERSQSQSLVRQILTETQMQQVEEQGQVDFSFAMPGVARFRGNAYRHQRGMDMVLRIIHEKPPSLEALGMPSSLANLVGFHQGMCLVTGPSGCGKSTTFAALLDIINTERPDHILTIEEPIEFVHPSKSCIVNQRQVPDHTASFSRALKGALREDPDVIAIGELRDLETVSLALKAAETGHFVLGTLHTGSAIRTLNRLIGVFPANQQEQIRTMVSESLKAIISQRPGGPRRRQWSRASLRDFGGQQGDQQSDSRKQDLSNSLDPPDRRLQRHDAPRSVAGQTLQRRHHHPRRSAQARR